MDPNVNEHFNRHRTLYEEAIRKHVCARCIDFGDDGFCHAQKKDECSILRNLREIVQVARAVRQNKIEPYVAQLREKVCAHCENTKEDGSCPVRDEVECCLDRYLPLVLEAIEEVDAIVARERRPG